jgi:hypothetical protein
MTTSGPEPVTSAHVRAPEASVSQPGEPHESLFVGPVGRPDEFELMGAGHKGGEGLVFRARFQGSLPRAVLAPTGRSTA